MDFTQLIPLLPQGASVVAVIMVVIIFLRFTQDNNKMMHHVHQECEKRLEAITTRTNGVVEDNTRALTQLVEAVKEMRSAPFR